MPAAKNTLPYVGHLLPPVCRAARDIRNGVWQDGFNMGVAAIQPNITEYNRLLELLISDKLEYGR